MTPVPDILASLQAVGIRVTLRGDKLIATPKAAVTPEIVSLIRAHKPELMQALSGDQHPQETEARRKRALELACHLRRYADRNGFSQADFEEALQVAVAGDLEGWLAYIRGQNETRH